MMDEQENAGSLDDKLDLAMRQADSLLEAHPMPDTNDDFEQSLEQHAAYTIRRLVKLLRSSPTGETEIGYVVKAKQKGKAIKLSVRQVEALLALVSRAAGVRTLYTVEPVGASAGSGELEKALTVYAEAITDRCLR